MSVNSAHTSNGLRWVESEGGPLLLLADDLLGFWEGVRRPSRFRNVEADFRWSTETGPTDYDRACDVNAYLGLIEVGPGYGLVLGDAPLRTTWFGDGQQTGGCFVRWIQAHSDADVRQAMASDLSMLRWVTEIALDVEAVPLVLFDSGLPGDQIGEDAFRMRLARGRYVMSTAEYSGDNDVQLLLHAVRRSS